MAAPRKTPTTRKTTTTARTKAPVKDTTPEEDVTPEIENVTPEAEETTPEVEDVTPEAEEKESSDVSFEILIPGTMVLSRPRNAGVLTLTAAQVDSTRDANGDTWVDIIDDEAAQREKFGKTLFRRA